MGGGERMERRPLDAAFVSPSNSTGKRPMFFGSAEPRLDSMRGVTARDFVMRGCAAALKAHWPTRPLPDLDPAGPGRRRWRSRRAARAPERWRRPR